MVKIVQTCLCGAGWKRGSQIETETGDSSCLPGLPQSGRSWNHDKEIEYLLVVSRLLVCFFFFISFGHTVSISNIVASM